MVNCDMSLKTFAEASNYIHSYIPKSKPQAFPGHIGWERTRYILEQLGNPQDQLRVIHVAGTSGKGSVSTTIYQMLHQLGCTVGLNLSPHLITIRERIQINGSYISEQAFVETLNSISPVLEQTKTSKFGIPTFFDVVTAMAYTYFRNQDVDYAVIETGMGGLLDGTNIVSRADKVCVITPIGYDHMEVLGSSLQEIASQKAGIIRPHNTVFSAIQTNEALHELQRVTNEQNGLLYVVNPQEYVVERKNTMSGTCITYKSPELTISELKIGLRGSYQVDNVILGLKVVTYIAKRDGLHLKPDSIRQATCNLMLPGRFDLRTHNGISFYLDGAHNTQKMQSFLQSLSTIKPCKQYTFIVSFKQGKDVYRMLEMIRPFAAYIILTSFINTHNDIIHRSVEPQELNSILTSLEFSQYECIEELRFAIHRAQELGNDCVVTGSLYLVSEVYRRSLL